MVKFVKLSKVKQEDALMGVCVVVDSGAFQKDIFLIKKISLIASSFVVVGIAALASYFFINLFFHTSYRFVSLFLLYILISNVLAKIVIKYLNIKRHE